MEFLQELKILFTGMTLPAVLALVIGFVLLLIEVFEPGFGVFGISGIVLTALGIALRVIVGDGNPYIQIFVLLFIVALGVFIAFLVLVTSVRRGWLNRSPLVELGTAVGVARSDGTEDYTALVGMLGMALTDLRPIGRANVGGTVVDVVSDGFYIRRGEGIRVVSVEGNKISVERAE